METADELISDFKNVIKSVKYMSIATCDENAQPWNTPLFTAYDNKYSFYWVSDKANVHSRNIKQNGKAFVTIYDSTQKIEEVTGVYMKGKACEVSNPIEMLNALKLLLARYDGMPKDIKHFQGMLPRRIYKFVPEKIWLNLDSEKDGEYVDTRIEVPISVVQKTKET